MTLVDSMGGRIWGLPTVIALALIFAAVGFALGSGGRRLQSTGSDALPAIPPVVSPAPEKAIRPAKRLVASTGSKHRAERVATPGRTFAWVATSRAGGYEVQFFRGAERVLSRRVKAPRLVLPRRWTYAGRNEALRPGTYRWYVWSIRGEPPRRAEKPVVQASFEIVPPG